MRPITSLPTTAPVEPHPLKPPLPIPGNNILSTGTSTAVFPSIGSLSGIPNPTASKFPVIPRPPSLFLNSGNGSLPIPGTGSETVMLPETTREVIIKSSIPVVPIITKSTLTVSPPSRLTRLTIRPPFPISGNFSLSIGSGIGTVPGTVPITLIFTSHYIDSYSPGETPDLNSHRSPPTHHPFPATRTHYHPPWLSDYNSSTNAGIINGDAVHNDR
ncbi:hypothetical protein BZA77DRAFT_166976 [Pyronema omphalodes]|nr:hypothetical protein BZA77DRAFT_166976 [Pyronema omphalodes]